MLPQVRTPGPAVLCIDEEVKILQFLMELLGTGGYRVLIAQSGERARRMLQFVSVEAVVLDHQPPAIDGVALSLDLKRMDPAIPILGYSAAPEEVPATLRGLAFRILQKGSPRETLTASLQEALGERRGYHGVREHLRYNVDMRVLVTAKTTPGVFWVNARSLGEGGLGAQVPLTLTEGNTVLLDFSLLDEYVTLPASVRYHSGSFHGFQFLDATPEQRTAIRLYCENLF